MTDKERNKIIAEAFGLCWHEWEATQFPHCKCKHCGEVIIGIEEDGTEHDFSTWPGFGIIMEKGWKREWWLIFWEWLYTTTAIDDLWFLKLINPPIMFAELSTWLSENEK